MFSLPGAGSVISSVRGRITSSRFAAIYLIFIAVYSVVQIGLHAQTLVYDLNASSTIDTLLISGRGRSQRIPALSTNSSLDLCSTISSSGEPAQCLQIWDASTGPEQLSDQNESSPSFSQTCILSLNYPAFVLHAALREDAVYIALHIYILALAVTAVAQQTLPHFVTGMVSQVVALILAGLRVNATMDLRSEFDRVISSGACGEQLLGKFWSQRFGLEVGTLAVDVFAMMLSGFLTWKAIKALGVKIYDDRFSPRINRLHKVSEAASVVLELSLFFSVAFGIVWINQIFYFDALVGSVGMGFKIVWLILEILMIPLFLLGWFSIRREMWKSALVFCGCSFIFVLGWAATFFSSTFRYSIMNWSFFGFTAVFGFLLAVSAFVLGVVCACYFGKGVKEITHGTTSSSSDDYQIRWTQSNITSTSANSRNDISSMEKGENEQGQSFEDKRSYSRSPSTDLASLEYGRVPKAKGTALRRGLSITPPPLQYAST